MRRYKTYYATGVARVIETPFFSHQKNVFRSLRLLQCRRRGPRGSRRRVLLSRVLGSVRCVFFQMHDHVRGLRLKGRPTSIRHLGARMRGTGCSVEVERRPHRCTKNIDCRSSQKRVAGAHDIWQLQTLHVLCFGIESVQCGTGLLLYHHSTAQPNRGHFSLCMGECCESDVGPDEQVKRHRQAADRSSASVRRQSLRKLVVS